MQAHQKEFLDFAIACEVLRFGEFTLKSGRTSPYFFNTGKFDTGYRLARLGTYYAKTLIGADARFDMLYGPAYKGIPLVCSVAMALAAETGREMPYAFNRKEAKAHGEGGCLVGAPLQGAVLIVDDVITAGTSVGESVEVIRAAGADVAGVVITLDRQERGAGDLSAVQEVSRFHDIPVYAIVTLKDITAYLASGSMHEELAMIRTHQAAYGIQGV